MGTVSAISDTPGLAGLAELAKDGHKPDKLYTWKYAPESDGWFRIHNALRGEMFKFKAVLEKLASTPLEPWQVSALQTYWQGHSALVHDHHDHEEKLFTPMIKRCEYVACRDALAGNTRRWGWATFSVPTPERCGT
jgi:hypothetical protein